MFLSQPTKDSGILRTFNIVVSEKYLTGLILVQLTIPFST